MKPGASELRLVAERICGQQSLELIKKVGEGAFKETFHVIGEGEEDHALKIFRPNMSTARTDREVAAMRRCDHDHIARLQLVDSIEIDGSVHTYILEEFLPGGTLSDRIETEGPLSTRGLLELAPPLVGAVAHIASHDLVHRDIKPDNILYRADKVKPVLVDFGIARDLASTPLTVSWLLRGPGTPFIASPEQLNNDRELIDWRTDQFALAVTLFIVRWGAHPFDEGDLRPDEIVSLVAERNSVSPLGKELAEAEGLELLLRMMSPWPIQRIRTPEALVREWENLRREEE